MFFPMKNGKAGSRLDVLNYQTKCKEPKFKLSPLLTRVLIYPSFAQRELLSLKNQFVLPCPSKKGTDRSPSCGSLNHCQRSLHSLFFHQFDESRWQHISQWGLPTLEGLLVRWWRSPDWRCTDWHRMQRAKFKSNSWPPRVGGGSARISPKD